MYVIYIIIAHVYLFVLSMFVTQAVEHGEEIETWTFSSVKQDMYRWQRALTGQHEEDHRQADDAQGKVCNVEVIIPN